VATWIVDESEATPLSKRATLLRDLLARRFALESGGLKDSTSRLRGRLLMTLPTTLALVGLSANRRGLLVLDALWAGDSRIYVLSPNYGLVQVTHDHLREAVDAQANLVSDSPISNCVSADEAFYLEEAWLNWDLPVIVIAASDGCFGYVRSPAEFEFLLLQALMTSRSMDDWKARLMEGISAVAADDATAAISPVGWDSYGRMRHDFKSRNAELQRTVDKLVAARAHSEKASMAAEARKAEYEELLASTWAAYKGSYQLDLPTIRSQP